MSLRISAKNLLKAFFVLALSFAAIQLVPYGHSHENPPVVREPAWNSPQTRQLAARACFDCHSNETVWPWYANVAPVSWLVQSDVQEGRHHLNFSEWGQGRRKDENAKKIEEAVSEGEMPPFQYRLMHPEARLSPDQKKELVEGLKATLGSPNGSRRAHSQ